MTNLIADALAVIDPDPNEAYDVIPMPDHPRGPHGWWTVTCNGIDTWHSSDHGQAVMMATNSTWRAQRRSQKKFHER